MRQGHVVHRPESKHLAADHSCEAGPDPDGQYRQDHFQGLAERYDHHQRYQDEGQGQQDIDQSHDEFVDPTPVPASQQAQHDADRAAGHQCYGSDYQRNARPVQNPGQHVPALLVGPQQVVGSTLGRPGRRRISLREYSNSRVVRRYQVREDSRHYHQKDDGHRYQRQTPDPSKDSQPTQRIGTQGKNGCV